MSTEPYTQHSVHEHTAHDLTAADPSGRHPVETGQLVMGIAFATFVAVWAGFQLGWWEPHVTRYLMPVPWVLGGAIGLVALAISSRRRAAARRRDQERARRAATAAAEEELLRREREQAAEPRPEITRSDPRPDTQPDTPPDTMGGTEQTAPLSLDPINPDPTRSPE